MCCCRTFTGPQVVPGTRTPPARALTLFFLDGDFGTQNQGLQTSKRPLIMVPQTPYFLMQWPNFLGIPILRSASTLSMTNSGGTLASLGLMVMLICACTMHT